MAFWILNTIYRIMKGVAVQFVQVDYFRDGVSGPGAKKESSFILGITSAFSSAWLTVASNPDLAPVPVFFIRAGRNLPAPFWLQL